MKLSVVMAVHDGESTLAATLESILAQTEPEFELLVVDDGSTDATPAILAAFASRDGRLRILTQQNEGLTRSLIRACAEVRAEVIARHDCGDRSHPERFARQLQLLAAGHVLTGCATRFTDAGGDTLYVARANGDELRRSLLHDDASHVHGLPHHGSAMFRRDIYLAAGGYRPQFRAAQDLDLWMRMAARGTIGVTDEVLYEATADARSISGTSRDAQVQLTALAVALRDGQEERSLLETAASIRTRPLTAKGEAAALYFIAKCLLQQRNPKWRRTMREALRHNPRHWRAWLSLLIGR